MNTYYVYLSEKAEEKLCEIYDHIASISLNLQVSDSFIAKLRLYIEESLSYFPERFPIYNANIRRAVYPDNRNYLIFFEIHEDVSEVRVLTIVNAKQYTSYRDIGKIS
uniref:ParE toxin of type II toxin-antitoxin system, parDE n=1 Tax=Candidatus Kentrum sp. FM TaxID=2126340 RepID=A0A450VYD7_9GAMM|nr:MAG: ParE toxin of type II toxin-antitoxin system, parDE [Candidatus Kentron sp. FM]VFJ53320.1 MAG: ParE toxin of type II toxin-antitoxin system, parDE [Candidatus Kentron sp. FM]VFK09798.1 MAG: ParE toxin of type II toxin-antitoxin system, parDE [Candidatus Kentron sp. FM]